MAKAKAVKKNFYAAGTLDDFGPFVNGNTKLMALCKKRGHSDQIVKALNNPYGKT